MSELDDIKGLIQTKQEEEIYTQTLPTAIPITTNALAKARLVGSLLDKKAGSSYEWYAFPLASKSRGYIIRDIILPKSQTISSAHVSVSGQEVAAATSEVSEINQKSGKDNYIIGWLHSHANFNPFHSGTDQQNILDVLNSVSLNTEFVHYRNFNVIESQSSINQNDGRLEITGQEVEDGKLVFAPDKNAVSQMLDKYHIEDTLENRNDFMKMFYQAINPAGVKVKEPVVTGFCYSVVVNNVGAAPDTLMAVIEEQVFTKQKKIYTQKIPLDIVTVEDDITVDEAELKKLVDKRIKSPRRFFEGFGKGYKVGKRDYRFPWEVGADQEGSIGRFEGDHFVWSPAYMQKGDSQDLKPAEDLDPISVTKKFVDVLFKYTYTTSGLAERYLDQLITKTIEVGNFEQAIDELGNFENSYGTTQFEPLLPQAYKEDLSAVLLTHVQDGNTRLLKFMQEFSKEQTYKRDFLKNITSILEDKDVKALLKKGSSKKSKRSKSIDDSITGE